ncbi:MAG: alpha/beta fold hydrolase [Methyloligellaceae bacterium]
MGSFFIGGRSATVATAEPVEMAPALHGPVRHFAQAGDYEIGQIYAQVMLPAEPISPHPVLLWHGGGMTGAAWETTPDGRPGWAHRFLAAGYDICVSDAVERGRASFPPPALVEGKPVFRPKAEAWETFRIGPAQSYATDPGSRRPHAGQRFPVASFDALCCQFVARWPALQPLALEAYAALVESFDGAVIVAHSQGGGYALETALAHPDHVRALVLIEPSGAPPPGKLSASHNLSELAGIPHLFVWGDFFAGDTLWQVYRQNVEAYADVLRDRGGRIDSLDLPAMGTKGNSHLLMMDDNSDAVFGMVAEWLKAQI